jgi:hypothetical protein
MNGTFCLVPSTRSTHRMSTNSFNLILIVLRLFYDDTCQSSRTDTNTSTCHLHNDAKLSCSRAVRLRSGAIKVSVTWIHVPYTSTLADKYRIGIARYPPRPRDLVNQAPTKFHVVYKYFPAESCLVGKCVGKSGWRRLLMFDTTVYNDGISRFLNIARLTNDPNQTDFVRHGVYKWDQCLNTFKHRSFAKFSYGRTKGSPVVSNIHDSIRYVENHIYTFIYFEY